MNGIVKAALRASSFKTLVNPLRKNLLVKNRAIWNMCNLQADVKSTLLIPKQSTCSCGCGILHVHTKGERELVEFLSEEIVAERKAQKIKNVPSQIDGFKVKLDGAEVNLTKKISDNECINVSFNVNHTVDAEADDNMEASPDKPDFTEMKSRPNFEVDIIRGKQTLSFTCSFMQDGQPAEGEGFNDVFGIDEVTMYEGEWSDKIYAVAGDVLDGYLYDLLMNLLEEKGITNEFVEKLAELSTVYEHTAYVGLLEGLSKFTTNGASDAKAA